MPSTVFSSTVFYLLSSYFLVFYLLDLYFLVFYLLAFYLLELLLLVLSACLLTAYHPDDCLLYVRLISACFHSVFVQIKSVAVCVFLVFAIGCQFFVIFLGSHSGRKEGMMNLGNPSDKTTR